MERGLSSRKLPPLISLNLSRDGMDGINSGFTTVLKIMRNVVGKHRIIGSKEYVLITSLIGLCDVEGKGEVCV